MLAGGLPVVGRVPVAVVLVVPLSGPGRRVDREGVSLVSLTGVGWIVWIDEVCDIYSVIHLNITKPVAIEVIINTYNLIYANIAYFVHVVCKLFTSSK